MTGSLDFLIFPIALVTMCRADSLYSIPVARAMSRFSVRPKKILILKGSDDCNLVFVVKIEQDMLKFGTRKMDIVPR
jgi:hypothetical protein